MQRTRPPFEAKEVHYWADQYKGDDAAVDAVGKKARACGYLIKDQFLKLGMWKTPRQKQNYERNNAAAIEEVTWRVLTRTTDERLRIEAPTLLHGVDYPVSSVILHWCHQDPYPIIDRRALWTLGQVEPIRYTFSFWREYVDTCRSLADFYGVDMRTLDRALWTYSKVNQTSLS